ncbi:MAG: DUF3298 domain-containing protein [Candidatus Pacebacteria bacterium]|nr:DUF3298 domain-containing protein [Candidatus Paceibacterota bacterium]
MDHKTRDILFILVIILIATGLLVWYLLARSKAPLTQSPVGTSTPVTTQAVPPAPALHMTDSGQYYDADLEYPSATPLTISAGAAANAAAVALMKAYATTAIATFKKNSDIADITPQVAEDQGLGGGNKYELSSTYKLYTSPVTISYVYTFYEDTLGAHPNANFQTFTFNSKNGSLLQISDLFKPGSSYLDTLSKLARAALTEQQGTSADASFIDPGTTPDAANFQAFALDDSDLVIYFSPYQVAPYALGPQTVRIPLDQLSSILNPDY